MVYTHDFHVHTYFSDGEMSPVEVVQRIALEGIQTIAVTDHENISAWHVLKTDTFEHITLIPGIELDVLCANQEMHLLGIGFDPNYPRMVDYLKDIQAVRKEIYNRVLQMINKILGEQFLTPEETFPIPHSTWMKPLIFKKLSTHPSFRNIPSENSYRFFTQWLNENRVHIHIPKPSIRDMISLIREAGGLPVLAHPGYYMVHGQSLESLLPELKEMGLAGIEVFYPYYQHKGEEFPTVESAVNMVHQLLYFAQKYGLAITQGSDTHLREHIRSRFPQLRHQHEAVGPFENPMWLSIPQLEALGRQI